MTLLVVVFISNVHVKASDDSSVAYVTVSFFSGKKTVLLARETQQRFANTAREMVRYCGFNSIQNPELFAGVSAKKLWRDSSAESHLYIQYQTPFYHEPLKGEKLEISEIIFGFNKGQLLAPMLGKHGEVEMEFTKCNGDTLVRIMCTKELRRYLRDPQLQICTWYDEYLPG